MWLFEEPLLFSDLLKTQTLQFASLRAKFRVAGCTKLGHLLRMTATSDDALRDSSNITSSRIINRVLEEVCAALPPLLRTFMEDRLNCEQWNEKVEYVFPYVSVTPALGEWQQGGGQLLSF